MPLFHDMMLQGSKKEITLLATDFDNQDTNVASYNFTMDIGTATSDRIVIVMIGAGEVQAREPTSITVNGYSLSKISSIGGSAQNQFLALWAGSVPLGNGNQTVSVTFGGSVRRNIIASVALSGASLTPRSNGTDRATITSPTVSLSPVVGDYVLSMIFTRALVTLSWTSPATYTQIGQTQIAAGGVTGAAMYHIPLTSSALNVVGNRGGDNTEALLTAASFAPA